jgi:hypothetical protein
MEGRNWWRVEIREVEDGNRWMVDMPSLCLAFSCCSW